MIKKQKEMMDKRCPKCHHILSIAEETRRPPSGTEAPSVMSRDGNIFDKRIWKVSDVARVLGCSSGHIYNLASRDEIPRIKKGKFLFFIPEEVLEWIFKGDST